MAAFGSRLPELKRGILATGSALKSSPISARFLPPGMEPNREWPGALYLGWAGTENDGNGSALIDNEILFRRLDFARHGIFLSSIVNAFFWAKRFADGVC
jgi:hypothetical protein